MSINDDRKKDESSSKKTSDKKPEVKSGVKKINLSHFMSVSKIPRKYHKDLVSVFEHWLRFNKKNAHSKMRPELEWEKYYIEYATK